MRRPVIGFAGWSGSGKTTLIEKLIPALEERGVRCAVIKHDVHGLSADETGKDSERFKKAGAVNCTLICSAPHAGNISTDPDSQKTPDDYSELFSAIESISENIPEADIILVEGFKHAPLPRIGISRKGFEKGFTGPFSEFIAIITDEQIPDRQLQEEQLSSKQIPDRQQLDRSIPCFDPDDIEVITEFIMNSTKDFTHFDGSGKATMVDVSEKPETKREASARARVLVNRQTFELIKSGGMKKGDVLSVAQLAGIMGAKKTSELIPLCHPLPIESVKVALTLCEEDHAVDILASASYTGRTGVEMEALTAAATAALTVYDMCKAIQRDIMITDIRLVEKSGGVHGDYKEE